MDKVVVAHLINLHVNHVNDKHEHTLEKLIGIVRIYTIQKKALASIEKFFHASAFSLIGSELFQYNSHSFRSMCTHNQRLLDIGSFRRSGDKDTKTFFTELQISVRFMHIVYDLLTIK